MKKRKKKKVNSFPVLGKDGCHSFLFFPCRKDKNKNKITEEERKETEWKSKGNSSYKKESRETKRTVT